MGRSWLSNSLNRILFRLNSVFFKIMAAMIIVSFFAFMFMPLIIEELKKATTGIVIDSLSEDQEYLFKEIRGNIKESIGISAQPFVLKQEIIATREQIEEWEGLLLGIGNSLNRQYGLIRIMSFDLSGRMIHDYGIDDDMPRFDPQQHAIKILLSQCLETESSSERVVASLKNSPYWGLCFLSEDKDAEVSNAHLFILDYKKILTKIKTTTGMDIAIQMGNSIIYNNLGKEFVDSIIKNQKTLLVTDSEGRDQHYIIGTSTLINRYNLTEKPVKLIFFVNSERIYTSFQTITTNLKYIILLVTVLSALLILATIYYFLRPMKGVTEIAQAVSNGDYSVRLNHKSRDEIGMVTNTIDNMLDKIQHNYKSIKKEISERKQAEEELGKMAYYDQLTSLPNRANFLSYLGRMLKRTKCQSDYLFAVLFIDLDRFKVVNDSLGHIIGDKLLVEVARRLEACTRPTDRISRAPGNDRVSRFGGDEFAIFLNDIKDISSATRVAGRIQLALQKPFNLDGHELYTSASIGIALSATGYKNEEDILRDADSAMYHAKDTGRAHAEIFDEAMHVSVKKILQLESDLRTAVEKEQFMVYYQPIVSATDSRITGAEALLRWNHPEQGFISPMDFIPIAEETGLILTIGEWILREACIQNMAWQDAGYKHILMKVNFSSRQFKDENLAEVVKKVVRETGLPTPLLDVEITESIAMADTSIRILNQLTAMGLQTSIDDFGTGYSSLGSLTRFPINTIKIDRTFVKEMTIDVNAKAIIKAIIAMAYSLNMEVVAEGVETEEQLAFLQSHQCDKIQGYLFSPPVPEEEFRKLLEQDKIGPSPINKHFVSMV